MIRTREYLELKAFLILARTTGMRKGEILSRQWSDIDLDSGNPCIYVRQTKNNEPKRIQLTDMAVEALRALPSYGRHEFVFFGKAQSEIQKETSKGRTRCDACWRRGPSYPRSPPFRSLNPDWSRDRGQYHRSAYGAQEPRATAIPAPPRGTEAQNSRSDRGVLRKPRRAERVRLVHAYFTVPRKRQNRGPKMIVSN
jgi:hypothetical protein